MGVFAAKEEKCVRYQVANCAQRLDGPSGAAGKIDNEARTARTGKGARESSELCVPRADPAHHFGDAWNGTIKERLGGFRRDITRPHASTARCEDQIDAKGTAPLE
jgi:hypothetical protein